MTSLFPHPLLPEPFGYTVRQQRRSRKLSQQALAEAAGISRNYLSQIERGIATNLSWQVRQRLTEVLGLEADRPSSPFRSGSQPDWSGSRANDLSGSGLGFNGSDLNGSSPNSSGSHHPRANGSGLNGSGLSSPTAPPRRASPNGFDSSFNGSGPDGSGSHGSNPGGLSSHVSRVPGSGDPQSNGSGGDPGLQLPPSLIAFAEQTSIPSTDLLMLARLKYRGQQPTTPEKWAELYEVIKATLEPS